MALHLLYCLFNKKCLEDYLVIWENVYTILD